MRDQPAYQHILGTEAELVKAVERIFCFLDDFGLRMGIQMVLHGLCIRFYPLVFCTAVTVRVLRAVLTYLI